MDRGDSLVEVTIPGRPPTNKSNKKKAHGLIETEYLLLIPS